MTTEATAKPKLTRERASGGRTDWVGARPITFDEFLEMFGEDDDVELVNGVGVQRMAAQLDHEKLFAWPMTTSSAFTEKATARTLSRTTRPMSPCRPNWPNRTGACD